MVRAVAAHPVADWSEKERSWSALMAGVAEGNENALTQLYDSTSRIVYGLVLRILGNSSSAEEVTLDVYLRVWRTARSYDSARGTVSSWLITLARSRAIDAVRSRQVRSAMFEQPLEEISDPQDRRRDPEQLSIESAQAHIISNLLAELPVDQRQAIKLAYFLGLSHSEIAARSGLPLGTVKTRIRLGMLRLRELLALYAEGL